MHIFNNLACIFNTNKDDLRQPITEVMILENSRIILK
jgi:hypothetical protein